MKLKTLFFSFMFAVCAMLGTYSLIVPTYATATASSFEDVSVWGGEIPTEISDSDFYEDEAKNFYIYTAKGFAYFSYYTKTNNFEGKNIYLETDIDLNDKTWTSINNFAGTFDGQGHYIYNLGSIKVESGALGLFNTITSTATIQDVHLRNISNNNSLSTNFGALVGLLDGGKVLKCSATGEMNISTNSTGCHIGGLIGQSTSGTIQNCWTKINLTTSSNSYSVGGIVGYISENASVSQCYNEGVITSQGSVGGIVGEAYGENANIPSIENCYNTGSIYGTGTSFSYVGGILGCQSYNKNNDAYLSLSNCYNSGEINATFSGSKTAGIVGYSAVINNVKISNCFNIGQTKGSTGVSRSQIVGMGASTGLVGENFSNLYYDSSFAYGINEGSFTSYKNLATFCKTIGFYESNLSTWAFDQVWGIDVGINGGLPYLVNTLGIGNPNNDTGEVTTLSGSGTENSPYLISTASELSFMAKLINEDNNGEYENAYFSLQNDIDLSLRSWTPIGTTENPFKGILDGNNFAISGVNLLLQNGEYCGLFGYVSGAVIKELTIADFNYVGNSTNMQIFGNLIGGVGDSCYIVDCFDMTGNNAESIGYASSSFYIINNLSNNSIDGNSTYINASIISTNSNAKYGYLIDVDPNGGTFYNKTNDVVEGKYQIIVDTNGAPISQTKDSTLKTVSTYTDGAISAWTVQNEKEKTIYYLPSDTICNSVDYAVKEGYKIKGYHTSKEVTAIGMSVVDFTPVETLYAIWEEAEPIQYKIYYNFYENENYGVIDSKAVDISYNYNKAYTSAEIKNNIISEVNKAISRPNFSIKDVYIKSNQEDYSIQIGENYYKVFDSNDNLTFINKGVEFYILWEGLEEQSNTITLQFKKSEAADDGLGYGDVFEWANAISSIIIKANGKEYSNASSDFTISDNDGSMSFNYASAWVDTIDEKMEIIVTLKPGFQFGDVTDLESSTQFNRGLSVGSSEYVSFFGDYIYTLGSTSSDSTESKTITFQNLNGNGTIEFQVTEAVHSFNLEVSDSLNFGFTFGEGTNREEFYLLTQSGDFKTLGDLGDSDMTRLYNTLSGNSNVHIGFNPFSGKLITNQMYSSSVSDYTTENVTVEDFVNLNGSCIGSCEIEGNSGNFVVFKIGENYYCFKYTDTQMWLYSGTWADATFNIRKLIMTASSITPTDNSVEAEAIDMRTTYKISYYTNSDFGMVFCGDGSDYFIEEYAIFENSPLRDIDYPLDGNLEDVQNSKNVTKIYYYVPNIKFSLPNSTLIISAKMTTAQFTFDMVIKTESEEGADVQIDGSYYESIVEDGNAPTLKNLTGSYYSNINFNSSYRYNVETSFAFNFWIDNSAYYQFAGRSNSNPWQSIRDNLYLFQKNDETQEYELLTSNPKDYFSLTVSETDKTRKSLGMVLSFNTGANDIQKLDVGQYKLVFVFEQVKYQIRAKAVDKNGYAMTKDKVVIYSEVTGSSDATMSKALLPTESFSIQTKVVDNGYYFYNWKVAGSYYVLNSIGLDESYIHEENGHNTGANLKLAINDIGQFYNKNPNLFEYDDTEDCYVLNFQAIYDGRQIRIEFDSQTAYFEHFYNGSTEDGVFRTLVSSSFYNMSYVTKSSTYSSTYSNAVAFNYQYGGGVSIDSISFSYANYNGSNSSAWGYNIKGYIIYDDNNIICKNLDDNFVAYDDESQIIAQITSIDEFLNNYFALYNTLGQVVTLKVCPILEQKEIDVNILDNNGGDVKSINYYYLDGVSLNIDAMDTSTEKSISLTANGNDLISYSLSENFFNKLGYLSAGWNVNIKKEQNDEYQTYAIFEYNNDSYVYSQNLSGYFSQYNGNKITVDITRVWKTRQYTIIYNKNDAECFGTATGTMSNSNVIYDSDFVILQNQFAFVGYYFDGWNTSPNGQGISYSPDDIVRVNYFVSGKESESTFYLYAIWKEKNYVIEIDFNGGEVDGQAITRYQINYNLSFANLKDGNLNNVELDLINATRDGYELLGFYVGSLDNASNKITGSSYFNSSTPMFSGIVAGVDVGKIGNYSAEELASATVSLKLIASWKFVGEVQFGVLNKLQRTYTGNDITLSLSDFEFDTNLFTIGIDSITTQLPATDISFVLTSSSATVSDTEFVVKNVGTYSVLFTITLTDVSTYYSKGTIFSDSVSLEVEVVKANLSYQDTLDNARFLQNIKYLVSLVEESGTVSTYNNFTTFDEIVSYIKESDETASALSAEDIYSYLLVKYITMAQSTYENFLTVRGWQYADYLTYFSENEEYCTQLQEKAKYLVSFSLSYLAKVDITERYKNTLTLISDSVQNVALEIDDIVMQTNTLLRAKNFYEIKAYLTSSDEIENYEIDFDGNGYYISLGYGYMLPYIFKIENTNVSNRTFYNKNYDNVNVPWGSGESVTINGKEYFQIAADIYLYMNVSTANGGNKEQDTVYNFYDTSNNFRLNDISVMRYYGSSEYSSITSEVNVLLDESFNFTILKVTGVANITVTASYLTKNNGFIETQDLPQDLSQSLLNVTKITYSLDGVNEKVLTVDFDNGTYSSEDGTFLLEIVGANTNNLQITIAEPVVNLVVAVANKNLSNYIRLIDMSDSQIEDLNIARNDSGDLKISTENLTFEDGMVSEFKYFATYSDLVLVNYDYNLPNNNDTAISYLKLGEDDQNNLLNLFASNFVMSDLKFMDVDGAEISASNLFKGIGGEYIGYFEDAFADINLKAYWALGNLNVTSHNAVFKTIVGQLPSISLSEAGYLNDSLSEYFDYTYEIVLNNQAIKTFDIRSDELSLELRDGGTLEDNGEYTVKISATLKPTYYTILDDISKTTIVNEDIKFTIELLAIQITDIEFLFNDMEYDGENHTSSISAQITYQTYDEASDSYTNSYTTTASYGTTGNWGFKIYNSSNEEITEIKNAGSYTVVFYINENIYKLNGISSENLTKLLKVLPRTIDLSSYNFELSKKFASLDGELSTTRIDLAENIKYVFSRDSGEDLGEYDIFLNKFESNNNNNYIVKYGDVTLYENGTYYNTETCVGVFKIVKSDTLKLYYEETELNNATLQYSFNGKPYSVRINDELQLQILNEEQIIKTIDLKLLDVASSEEIVNAEIIEILQPILNQISINMGGKASVSEVGTYAYSLQTEENSQISNYYSNFVFAEGYSFVIDAKDIDVTSVEKVFDGTKFLYLNTDFQAVDLTNYEGVYITAEFSDIHVGTNISVALSLGTTNSQIYSIGDYILSADSTVGKIVAIQATISISFNKKSYSYGELNINNLMSNLTYNVTDSSGTDYTDLFNLSAYNLALDLLDENTSLSASTNAQGFYYVGEYNLSSNSVYSDFIITENLGGVEITPYLYEIVLPESYIKITTLDMVQEEYVETRQLNSTGDTFQIRYAVDGLESGRTYTNGKYNLVLKTNTYSNGNIQVSINEANFAFEIVVSSSTVYVQIENSTILNQTYNAKNYTITTSAQELSITIENEDESFETVTSEFSFYYYDSNNAKITLESIVLTNLSVTAQDGETTFKLAGEYKLAITAESQEFSYIVFAENYYFTIEKSVIDVTSLDVNKTYDGTNKKAINSTALGNNIGLGNDIVSIEAIYSSSDAGERDVTLYLSGDDANNYALSNSSTTGTITKAKATLILKQSEFVFGNIKDNSSLEFMLQVSTATVTPSDLEVNYTIVNADYVDNFLAVKEYSITATATSNNYDIYVGDLKLNITARPINITLNVNGLYSANYGSNETTANSFSRSFATDLGQSIILNFVRMEGNSVGYYKVLSASTDNANYTVSSCADNSTSGAYRIVASNEKLYILASTESELSAGEDGIVLELEFDSKTYSAITLETIEEKYYLVLTSTTGAKKNFAVSFYRHEEEKYTKVDFSDSTVTASMSLSGNVNKVGSYYVYASSVTSENFNYSMGKDNGNLYSFEIKVLPKELEFKVSEFRATFNNKNVSLYYENAEDVLTGLVTDGVSITISFVDENGSLVKYAGEGYKISATLSGENAENYTISSSNLDSIVANIEKAQMSLIINSVTLTYGETFEITYSYSTDIDLTNYDSERTTATLSVVDAVYSTSGYLIYKEGGYSISCSFESEDFTLYRYICDGLSSETLTATVKVKQKSLSIRASGTESLLNVFTKTYDGTKALDIEGKLSLENVVEGDSVQIDTAKFLTPDVGSSKSVQFTLIGSDAGNYTLEAYPYGKIQAVNVNIIFDTILPEEEISSSTAVADRISDLNYPFITSTSLTGNSADSNKSGAANFPTRLTDTKGRYTFLNWNLKFNVVENSEQYNFLLDQATMYSINYTFENGVFAFVVANNEQTVSLLNKLLSDENDYFGTYYPLHNDISFTFVANWEGQKYQIVVKTVDENDNLSTACGTVKVNGANMPTSTYSSNLTYGDELTIEATANEHRYVVGFYDSDSGEEISEDGDFIISSNGQTKTLKNALVSGNQYITIKFAYKLVTVTLDVSSYTDVDVTLDDNFKEKETGKYVWETTYDKLSNFKLSSLPKLTRAGYQVSAYSFAGFGNKVAFADFASTNLSDFVIQNENDAYMISYQPLFEEKDIIVTLDYSYGNISAEVHAKYGETYANAEGWINEVPRDGYIFCGWFTKDGTDYDWGVQITGANTVTTASDHSLFAKWEIQKFSLYLTLTNATISEANVSYTQSENVFIFTENYDTELCFKVVANEGYELPTDISDKFTTCILNDSNTEAEVTFKIPAQTTFIEISAQAKENNVTINVDNIQSLKVYDINDNEIITQDNQFKITSDTYAKIIVTAKKGYYFTENVIKDIDVDLFINHSEQELQIEFNAITSDLTIELECLPKDNQISLVFEQSTWIENLIVSGEEKAILEAVTLTAETGENVDVYIQFKYGFMLNTVNISESGIKVEKELAETGQYAGYYHLAISDFYQDETITILAKRIAYTVQTQTVVYDENQQQITGSDNKALVNGQVELEVDYETNVELTVSVENLYSFAGWSYDGLEIFDSNPTISYTVTKDITIYAIFSKLKFNLNLSAFDKYNLYEEYNDSERIETVYKQIYTPYYKNSNGDIINKLELYYGSTATLYLSVPSGYYYTGFGYVNSLGQFVYLSPENNSSESEIEMTISTFSFDTTQTNINIFAILKSYEAKLSVSSYINFDGSLEEDNDVGKINLVGEQGNIVNEYGYVEGTRVHYNNFASVNERNFEIISYTADAVYLKISVEKKGYKFSGITSNSNVTINKIGYFETENPYYIYQISNIVGDGGVTPIAVNVYYEPFKNIIDLHFNSDTEENIDGGVIVVKSDYGSKVWTNGQDYSDLFVTAFTDTSFNVTAYIKIGFRLNSELIKYDSNLITVDNIQFEELEFTSTGFVYKVYFEVSNYITNSSISIQLEPKTYTVLLKDTSLSEEVQVTIKNVKFNSLLDLSYSNRDNIVISDSKLKMTENGLNLIQTKTNYNYFGYYTYQNGQGKQYINSNGLNLIKWTETGYYFDEKENKYLLSNNVEIDDDGDIIITLYLYWAYLKTQIQFSFVPDVKTNVNAQDIVGGVDKTNSWFYSTSPYYIEVSFNTNITITAPNIEGYKFYKFVIKQKDYNYNWLTDVVSYSESIPWSTNEFDRIVEVKVEIYYFAKVEVQVFGGEMKYSLSQDAENSSARALLKDFYVDTTKNYTLTALRNSGYDFVYWQNITTGEKYAGETWTAKTQNKVIYLLYVTGKTVTLNFEDYDSANGQIVSLQIRNSNSILSTKSLGYYNTDGSFVKSLTKVSVNVGDTIVLLLKINFGFGVEWNDETIKLMEIDSEYYYFEYKVSDVYADSEMKVIPKFTGESIALYIKMTFEDNQIIPNALDENDADLAGYVMYNSKKSTLISDSIKKDIIIDVVNNLRYALYKVYIQSPSQTVDCTQVLNEGKLYFTSKYLSENSIAGTLILNLQFVRIYHTGSDLEVVGDGSKDNPYQIATAEELAYFMDKINSGEENENGVKFANLSYIVMEDITLEDKFWTPIGTEENPFNGTFNFNNHKINGIYLASHYDSIAYNGLFGVIGEDAIIIYNIQSIGYIFIIMGIILGLFVILILSIVLAKKRKKLREELNNK